MPDVVVTACAAETHARRARLRERRPRDRRFERIALVHGSLDDLRAGYLLPLHRAARVLHDPGGLSRLAGVHADFDRAQRASRWERDHERRVVLVVTEASGAVEAARRDLAAEVDARVVVLERAREHGPARGAADRGLRGGARRPLAQRAVELHGCRLLDEVQLEAAVDTAALVAAAGGAEQAALSRREVADGVVRAVRAAPVRGVGTFPDRAATRQNKGQREDRYATHVAHDHTRPRRELTRR